MRLCLSNLLVLYSSSIMIQQALYQLEKGGKWVSHWQEMHFPEERMAERAEILSALCQGN